MNSKLFMCVSPGMENARGKKKEIFCAMRHALDLYTRLKNCPVQLVKFKSTSSKLYTHKNQIFFIYQDIFHALPVFFVKGDCFHI